MNGIIFCVCFYKLAIPVLQFDLKRWQKRVQQDSGEEWVTAISRPMINLTARAHPNLSSSTPASPVKRSHGNQDPWSTIADKEERSGRPDIGIDRLKASDHNYHEQFMESLSSACYSKCDEDRAWSFQEWKLILRHTSDWDDLIKFLGKWYEKFDLVTRKFVSTEPRNPLGTRKHLVTDQVDPISILKKWQDLKISSWEAIKQNWNCLKNQDHSWIGWMIRCEKFKCYRKLWKTLWFGECSWLWPRNQHYSWERITRTIVIPSKIQKISHSNKCSTYL